MNTEKYTPDEIADTGELIYQTKIRPMVEGAHSGKYLVLDIESEEYAIGDTDADAIDRMKERKPDGALYIVRIGHPAAYRLGSHYLKAAG